MLPDSASLRQAPWTDLTGLNYVEIERLASSQPVPWIVVSPSLGDCI
jgi:hypothetical protein